MKYANKYGQWYYENEVYFEQYLNLRQGKLTVDEYANEFDRLQCLCKLESETHDFNHFLKGSQPCILKNMKDRKDMHNAYSEVIHVERLIKHNHL